MPRISRNVVLLPLPLWPIMTRRSCALHGEIEASSITFLSNASRTSASLDDRLGIAVRMRLCQS